MQQLPDSSLPRWKSIKTVHAVRLSAITRVAGHNSFVLNPVGSLYPTIGVDESNDDDGFLLRLAQAIEKHPADPGYFVLYPDGYRSWSPTEAFEAGYIPD